MSIPLLLSDPSPILRYLVLKNLLHKAHDDLELQELKKQIDCDTRIQDIKQAQKSDGSWDDTYELGIPGHNPLHNTAQILNRLSFFEIDLGEAMIKKAVEFLFSFQHPSGSWDNSTIHYAKLEKKTIYPINTALILRSIAAVGYSTNIRAEKAYDWLLNKRTNDGSWPVKITESGNYAFAQAGYRKMPNSRYGCRSTTTEALHAFSFHPERSQSIEIKQAMDLLLARETKNVLSLGFEVARRVGFEMRRGFITYHAEYDVAHILSLIAKLYISIDDDRVKNMIEFINSVATPYGIWEYQNRPQASRWITYDILNSLAQIAPNADWISYQPRTKFKAYPRKKKRY